MKILLEGPDRTGKSTLAKVLCELYKAQYIHYSYIENDILYFNQLNYISSFILHTDGNLVIDRLFPSEDVYGTIYRGKSRLSNFTELHNENKGYIEDVIRNIDLVVFCLPNKFEDYVKFYNTIDRDEYVKDTTKLKDIFYMYQDLYVHYSSIIGSDKVKRYDILNIYNKNNDN